MTEDCWEARMSARAKAREQIVVERSEQARQAVLNQAVHELELTDPASWLHGWSRLPGDVAVLVGTGVHCAGCGRLVGVTTVVFEEGWQPPGPEPDWPFVQSECPVCAART